MLAGDPADNNAKLFKQGANEALKAGGVKIAKSYDTPGWTADKAQNEMQQAITALGNNGFDGVLAANDDLGGGAIAAMKWRRHQAVHAADDRAGRDRRRAPADPHRASST